MAEQAGAAEPSYAERVGRPEAEAALLGALWNRRPRVVVKADLLPSISVLSLVALLGLGIALIWSRIAPAEHMYVGSDGQAVPLPDASYHLFDDVAIFVLISLGFGLLIGVAVWLLRERRGPVILLASVIGAVIGGWLAARTGVSFAHGLYPIGGAPSAGSVVAKAPTLDAPWLIIVQPLGVAIAYGVLAAWNGRHDLGRRLG
ncbi:MAG: DUF2567 domain-containing protein [Sciscionella sp.]